MRPLTVLRRAIPIALICGAALAGSSSAAEAPSFKEYQMKAAFLFNFAKFVQWPGAKDAQGPIVLGVLGPNPFGAHLENLVKGRQINGREIQVRQFDSADAARAAHVLFVAKGFRMAAAKDWASLEGAGVLTVGEPTAFSERGGIITFQFDGERLAFEIDMDGAQSAGLTVSVQLQKLAKAVRRR